MQRNLVVVGASAGGVEALRTLVSRLPEDLPAALVVVLHMPAGGSSALPLILRRSGALPVRAVEEGMPLQTGHVHVAPPDHHVLVQDEVLRLSTGPTQNGHRPAIDALFRSAAVTRGAGVIGVILSGALSDGTGGMAAIKNRGGITVVQAPDDARCPGMPANVLKHVEVDHVEPVARLGGVITGLVREPGEHSSPPRRSTDGLESAMWTAVRTLEEKVALARGMIGHSRDAGLGLVAERYARQEAEALAAADVLRKYLLGGSRREETGA
ncbi:chemotaxis protein CheB [Lentzea sp. NPDC051838]|uniref:chemotaxis protein CheB n=1 Tax=Lentzea sp. NPDC051838 TaxID=3154849 RepID=UPI0034479CC4